MAAKTSESGRKGLRPICGFAGMVLDSVVSYVDLVYKAAFFQECQAGDSFPARYGFVQR